MDDDSKMPAKKGAKRSAGNQEETKQSSGAAAEPTAADKRRKDKQLPSRPLSAYNLFFKEERVIILENQKKGVAQPDFVFPTEEELKQQVAAGKKKAPKQSFFNDSFHDSTLYRSAMEKSSKGEGAGVRCTGQVGDGSLSTKDG